MAIHTQLPIYKVTYDLLVVVVALVKNMPREFKQSIGGKIRDECIEVTTLVFRANVARDKAPHLLALLEHLQPVARGIDFVGQVVKPWRRSLRRRTLRAALARAATIPLSDLLQSANSYFGLLRQTTAGHADRVDGLIDTKDVNEWENSFLKGIVASTRDGDTRHLTGKQVEVVERIYDKHFA